jgi:inorganic pyrophosphatase
MIINTHHPWHSVDIGPQAPQIVKAIIEISRGSKGKYELNKETGLLELDRVLFSAVHYPANYGFIPRTYYMDNDPLDILVFCSVDIVPLCMTDVRVVGVIHMTDDNGPDDKIVGVVHNDEAFKHVNDITDLTPHTLNEVKRFFMDYKILENKKVEVGDAWGKEKAYECINTGIQLYKDKIKK